MASYQLYFKSEAAVVLSILSHDDWPIMMKVLLVVIEEEKMGEDEDGKNGTRRRRKRRIKIALYS